MNKEKLKGALDALLEVINAEVAGKNKTDEVNEGSKANEVKALANTNSENPLPPSDFDDAIANIVSFGMLSDEHGAQIKNILGIQAEELRNSFRKEHEAILNSEIGALLEDYLQFAQASDYEKIGKILSFVKQNAVEELKKKESDAQNIANAYENAKQKLKTYSSGGSRAKHEAKKPYTLAQIGKMSAAEFARAHDKIMNDFQNGLIV